MSYATEATAIRTRFYAQWGSTTSVAKPNVDFTPPDEESWVRLEIEPSGADQTTMGDAASATYWYDGTVTVQVFTPKNTGDNAARTLAEQVCAIFRNVEADGIIYDTPYTTTAGMTDNGYYQLNVWAPYRRKST